MAKKSMSRADKNTVKAIKAFNERLRYARRRYGADSEIVEDMINQARHVVKLRWIRDKTGEEVISTGKENIGFMKRAWEREEFNKYISNNSARNLLNATIYTRNPYQTGLKGTPRSLKASVEESFYKDFKQMFEMYNQIWWDVYHNYDDDSIETVEEQKELASRCYLAAKNPINYAVVKTYAKGKISLDDLVDILEHGMTLEDILNPIQPTHPQTKADKDEALNEIATHDDYFDLNNDDYFDNDYFDDFGSDYP